MVIWKDVVVEIKGNWVKYSYYDIRKGCPVVGSCTLEQWKIKSKNKYHG